jgi:hypothetical protein
MLKVMLAALFGLSGLFGTAAFAQSAASAPVSAAKKELVVRLVKLHNPAIENLGRTLAEQPIQQMSGAVRVALAQLPADKRDAAARDIEADVKRFLEDVTPVLRDRGVAIAPATIGSLFEQRFSEDELRQLLALIESPVHAKYQAMTGEMQRVLGTKLVAETRAQMEPKVKALEQSVRTRLQRAIGPAASAPGN